MCTIPCRIMCVYLLLFFLKRGVREYMHLVKNIYKKFFRDRKVCLHPWASDSHRRGHGLFYMMEYYSAIQNPVFEKYLMTWEGTHYVRSEKKDKNKV